MKKMLIPMLETVIDSEGFVATARDGQLRSDLLRVTAPKADRCRIWRQKPEGDGQQEYEELFLTPETAAELWQNRSGRWEYYAVQLLAGGRLLLSAGRYGCELMLFEVEEERTKELCELLEQYSEVTGVRIYPMPEEVLSRCARRVV